MLRVLLPPWCKQGEADATWVFMGWEGIEAKMKGVELNVFRPEDHGVQYGYSPVLVAHPDTLRCGHMRL